MLARSGSVFFRIAMAAATRAEGGAFLLPMISASVAIAAGVITLDDVDASFHLTSLPPERPNRAPPCSQSTSPRRACHARLGSQELPTSVTLLAMTVGRPSADADEAYAQEQQPQVWSR
jgi:hypothetical protein